STAVLVFVKGGKTERVWYYDLRADGYSLDDKRDEVAQNDIPDLLRRWRERDPAKDTDRTAQGFFVPAEEIRANKYDLSLNRYREVAVEEIEYEEPAVILARLRELEREIAKELDELEGMLK
ncbi:MAG: N-6 DNA methylase, partial [Gemmatimonadota bacterium]|nr:N-6 DNA methylase [Gemmatimonadota bacterium]